MRWIIALLLASITGAAGAQIDFSSWQTPEQYNALIDQIPDDQRAWPAMIEGYTAIRSVGVPGFEIGEWPGDPRTNRARVLRTWHSLPEVVEACARIREGINRAFFGAILVEGDDPEEARYEDLWGIHVELEEYPGWIQALAGEDRPTTFQDRWIQKAMRMKHIGIFLQSEAATNATYGINGPVRENLVAVLEMITKDDLPNSTLQQYNKIARIATTNWFVWAILDRHPESMDAEDLRVLAEIYDRLESDGHTSYDQSGFKPEVVENLGFMRDGTGGYTPEGIMTSLERSHPSLIEDGITETGLSVHIRDHMEPSRVAGAVDQFNRNLARLISTPWDGSLEEVWEGLADPEDPHPEWTRVLLELVHEGTSEKFFKNYVLIQTQVAATQVVIAIHRHRLRHAEFPASLDVLDADLLPVIPTDPMSGAPIRYMLTEDGPVVYSAGADRDDDGGHHPLDQRETRAWQTVYWAEPSEIEQDASFNGDYVIYPPDIND